MERLPRDLVAGALRREAGGLVPKGELFLGDDFLNEVFPEARNSYVAQLGLAAGLLGLSAVGVDLNGERGLRLLGEGAYRDLGSYFTIGCINGPFARLTGELGFSKGMVRMRKDGRGVLDDGHGMVEEVKAKCALARANGMSAIALADDIAGNGGLFFSYADFEAMFLPVYGEIARAARAEGLAAFFHCDGDTMKIIESLIDAGYECIHPVDDQAGMDIVKLREAYGDRVSFMGHIDTLSWDSERARREIEKAGEDGARGGLILGSSGGLSGGPVLPALAILYPGLESMGSRKITDEV